jgi:hypothetical protein
MKGLKAMNTYSPPISKNTRSPQQIQAQQRADAEKAKAAAGPPKATPTVVAADGGVVATFDRFAAPAVDTRPYRERYLDEVAPAMFPGKLVKFSKDGKFVVAESGEEISPDADFVALCDETLIGWIRFSDQEGEPPQRIQGILHDGFQMPPREALGDTDPAQWPIGLSGQPEDPWQHQVVLVLQNRETLELFSFSTSSKTGRRAIGNLLRTYDRLQRSHPDTYPVIRLKASGFNHRDTRIGWVPTPSFAVVGRAPKADAAVPDTSVAADMGDQIPF